MQSRSSKKTNKLLQILEKKMQPNFIKQSTGFMKLFLTAYFVVLLLEIVQGVDVNKPNLGKTLLEIFKTR